MGEILIEQRHADLALTLRATRGTDAVCALHGLLKVALRGYGFHAKLTRGKFPPGAPMERSMQAWVEFNPFPGRRQAPAAGTRSAPQGEKRCGCLSTWDRPFFGSMT